MSNPPDRTEIEAILERICTHKQFANSSVYNRLLRYLVEKHYAKEDLKEYTIASELFGKKQGSKDATIRSYMYNLRKRLASYYADPETDESVRFVVEKGQYNLSFETVELPKQSPEASVTDDKRPISTQKLLLGGIVALIAILFVFVASQILRHEIPSCWNPFFETSARNIVVISDQMIVSDKNQNGHRRDHIIGTIKNANDLIEHLKQNPEQELRKADYTVMTKMAPYSVKMLTEWFVKHDSDYTLLLESDLKFEDIRTNNILFIGQRKTMDFSNSLFLKDSKRFESIGDGYVFTSENGEKQIYQTIFADAEKTEYAMVSVTSFVEGKSAFYFVSNHDIGVMALVRNFTNPTWLNEFSKQFPVPNDANHFNALFEVTGLHRNDVSCKLVAIEKIEHP